ncbi:MAG: hypothetical protein U0802_24080 [Candidatus Binatia bacterium]
MVDWLLDHFAPPLVGYIAVTQDEQPLLITASQFSGGMGIYDAGSGAFCAPHRADGMDQRRVGGAVGWPVSLVRHPAGAAGRPGAAAGDGGVAYSCATSAPSAPRWRATAAAGGICVLRSPPG